MYCLGEKTFPIQQHSELSVLSKLLCFGKNSTARAVFQAAYKCSCKRKTGIDIIVEHCYHSPTRSNSKFAHFEKAVSLSLIAH